MAFIDDDEEVLTDVVSDYYFYDAEDQPISFAELPVHWSNGERSHDNDITIYLRGTTDNGLQRLHKQVMAWKYEFSKENPEISVLSKVNNWIKLQKPRKSFESIIRTILITVQCLHFFNRKPNASSKDLRDHLYVWPSENDLTYHLNFIREAVKKDETLQASEFLDSFLNGRHKKVRFFYQVNNKIYRLVEQHQCFVCGKLGSSNKSYGAEVFRCSSATCGHFYHPHCVAKLLENENNTEEKIAGAKPFTCPVHVCHKCKKKEDETVKGLQFAVCRRCPTTRNVCQGGYIY
ncbi:putative [histone H3]-lysine(4) N-trimethyltransferase chromatin regulator PHD family [Helianthus anomalus]